MSLTGIPASDPNPRIAREYVFGAGVGAGIADDRPVVLMGNKSSAGSAPVDTITDPIESDQDAQDWFGPGSELDLMFRRFMLLAQEVDIRAIPIAESGGTAAALKLVVANDSSSVNGWRFKVGGEVIEYIPTDGAEETATADGIEAAFNDYDGGRLPFTAAASSGTGDDFDVDLTFRHKGTRGTHYLNELVVESLGTNDQTVTKSTLTSGATEDDWTNAIIEAGSLDEPYYFVASKTATSAPSTTDNGLGELQTELTNQTAPSNGKDNRLFYGLVGTSAEAITVPPAAPMNSPFSHGIQLEDCPLLPGQIAAFVCAFVRRLEVAHPNANCNRAVMVGIPAPYSADDYPTNTEVTSQLNNGVTPLKVEKGRVILHRFVSNRCLNDDGLADFKAREGQIGSVMHFVNVEAQQRYRNIAQDMADYDVEGADKPIENFTTPSDVRAMWEGIFNDLSGSRPLGQYRGPMLAPSRVTEMKERLDVSYNGLGKFPVTARLFVAQHNLGTLVRQEELSVDY